MEDSIELFDCVNVSGIILDNKNQRRCHVSVSLMWFRACRDSEAGVGSFRPHGAHRIAQHHEMNRLGNVVRVIADAFNVFNCKQQMRGAGDGLRIIDHGR